jgi:hypothetical protein
MSWWTPLLEPEWLTTPPEIELYENSSRRNEIQRQSRKEGLCGVGAEV